jgi:hypothetical protein
MLTTLEDEHEWGCECDQCRADDAEHYAIYRFEDGKNLEMWTRYQRNHPNGMPLPSTPDKGK